MAERNLAVDHVTIWRWVQRYAPELHRRCRPELRMTNRSWRVDETYLRVAGKWTIYTEPWIPPVPRLSFSYRLDGMLLLRKASSRRRCARSATLAHG